MESPVKKLDLGVANKENEFQDPAVATLIEDVDAKHASSKADVTKTEEDPVKAPELRPEELDEPILRENPQRFVLFPIQYHEVRDSDASDPHTFYLDALSGTITNTLRSHNRSGKCTRSMRLPSGLLRR